MKRDGVELPSYPGRSMYKKGDFLYIFGKNGENLRVVHRNKKAREYQVIQ